jgi:hypothetical protein
VKRVPGGDSPTMPTLHTIDGVIARKLLKGMDAESVARREGLIVRAYRGDQPEDHMAHLIHMAATVLPDLTAWWSKR